MRTSIFAMIVVAGSAIAFSATAQERQAAPSEQPKAQMKRDVDKGLKNSGPDEQMQRDADKGVKTRNSGESGYVADQDKPGAAAHPPGQPTTGSTTQQTTGATTGATTQQTTGATSQQPAPPK
jgi:hypothetical protein